MARRHADGFPLLRGVGDALFPLYPGDEAVQIFGYQRLPLAQFQNTLDDVGFVLEEVTQVDRRSGTHEGGDYLSLKPQGIQSLGQQVSAVNVQQPGRGAEQLFPGEKAVAAVQVAGQGVLHSGLHPQQVVCADAAGGGDPVRVGEAEPHVLVQKQIGVGPENVNSPVGIAPPQGETDGGGELKLAQKLHEPPHSRLLEKLRLNRPGFFQRHAFERGQLLRLGLNDGQRISAKFVHDAPGGLLADALDDAGGEVFKNALGLRRYGGLHGGGLELGAKGGVIHPHAGGENVLAGRDVGHLAHHGLTALLGLDPENGVAVLRVLIDDRRDGAL